MHDCTYLLVHACSYIGIKIALNNSLNVCEMKTTFLTAQNDVFSNTIPNINNMIEWNMFLDVSEK